MIENKRQVDKLQAAKRQINCAIDLWLEDYDRLAVHTIIMAAFGIIKSFLKKKGYNLENILSEYLSKVGWKGFYMTANFLKHADRDLDEKIFEFDDTENEWRIGLCIVIYRVVSGSTEGEMGAFHLMYLSAYPEKFCVAPDPDPIIEQLARDFSEVLRKDIEERRNTVRKFLKAISNGGLDPNMSLRRIDDSYISICNNSD